MGRRIPASWGAWTAPPCSRRGGSGPFVTAALVRSVETATAALAAGADGIIVFWPIFQAMLEHPLTAAWNETFAGEWRQMEESGQLEGSSGTAAVSRPRPRRRCNRARRPANILLLLTDEHGAQFSGTYGHPFIATPAMDRLAAEGVTFDAERTATTRCACRRGSRS